MLDGERVVAVFERNYPLLAPFEPFRQHGKDYALISADYTAAAVLDLFTGAVIASETPAADGFCPVGFYVHDWWDVHDGTVLPGSSFWHPTDHEWPDGTLGFVWGCHWGDDQSWKVQCLNLSQIGEGYITRDERFGYVTLGVRNNVPLRDIITVSSHQGRRVAQLLGEQSFGLDDVRPLET